MELLQFLLSHQNYIGNITRTTRTLRSEDTPCSPMITHTTTELYWIPSQSQSYKFKEFDKTSNSIMLKQSLHHTHPLKLFDRMCIYEMDLVSIVEDTERTWFCPQMDRRMGLPTDRQTRWNQYTPLQLCWVAKIMLIIGHAFCCPQNLKIFCLGEITWV